MDLQNTLPCTRFCGIISASHIHCIFPQISILYIHCPKNTKSDIDGIIDYLAEANHDTLVGFSEENRLKVQAVQGKPLHTREASCVEEEIKRFKFIGLNDKASQEHFLQNTLILSGFTAVFCEASVLQCPEIFAIF